MRSRPTQLRQHDVSLPLDEECIPGSPEDVQRDLVGHRRRREKDRLLVTEEFGPSPLELVDGRVLALLLVADRGVRDRLAHRLRRLGQGIGAKIDHPPILQF